MKNNSHRKPIYFLSETITFPSVEHANSEGLLAVGGDLSSERLLLAYQSGIFPWFNEDSLIFWWSPNPRMVLFPDKIKISKTMNKLLKSNQFKITKNKCFKVVIENCSKITRKGQDGTWITNNIKNAYLKLHEEGIAQSYEVWENDELVGGLYGIDLGTIFCGESMFSLVDNASKFAFIHLALELQSKNYKLIDCQIYTSHLQSLGAEEIPRTAFIELLQG